MRAKILDLAIFSDQEALSLHFSLKLKFNINLLSSTGCLAILNVKCCACTLTYIPSNLVWEQEHTKVKHITLAENGPAMLDRFWCLCNMFI